MWRMLLVLGALGCATPAGVRPEPGPSRDPEVSSETAPGPAEAPPAPDPIPAPSPEPVAEPAPPTPPLGPRPLTDDERAAMTGVTWRPECPVPLEDLRAVDVAHVTPAGDEARGTLIVHHDVAAEVAAAFAELHAARFPITSVRPAWEFGGDDAASMRADNTSAFNCRPIGRGARWSEHAHGRAIDVNPLRNPWVRGDVVRPPEGRAWIDRDPEAPGVIVAGGPAEAAFRRIGWRWGGRWRSAKDYQHFSKNGW